MAKIHEIAFLTITFVCGLSSQTERKRFICKNPRAECRPFFECLSFQKEIGQIKDKAKLAQHIRNNVCSVPLKVKGVRDTNVCCVKETKPTTKKPIVNTNGVLPKGNECGKPTTIPDRIIGGTVVPVNGYPWMSTIIFPDSLDKYDLQCSATVITAEFLLTAAHCVHWKHTGYKYNQAKVNEKLELRIGEWDRSNEGRDCQIHADHSRTCKNRPAVRIKPVGVYIHPNYSYVYKEQSFDIALLQISPGLDFAETHDHITPICLPEKDFSIESLPKTKEAIAAGWGRTEDGVNSALLKDVRMPFASKERCREIYYNKDHKIYDEETIICAGGREGKDSCNSDSGGPLMIDDGHGTHFTQIGIVSVGRSLCGRPDSPALYTDIAKFMDWIEKTVETYTRG